MTTPAVLVVVVAYRADDHLARCLAALDGGLDVLVVDNDAAPSTREVSERHGAGYLPLPANVGFARAVNAGLGHASGRDVLLLNPDALIDADDVRALQAALRDPAHRRAAVGPTLVGADGRAEPASWPVPSPRQVWADAVGRTPRRAARFVTGAVLMLRAEALAELGGLDERYFLYAEEADWQVRAQRAGWEVAVVTQVRARHVGAASSGNRGVRDAHFDASARTFARRWHGRPGAAVMRAGSVAAALRRAVAGPDRIAGRRDLRRQVRAAQVGAAVRPSVLHVVRSDSFAGVERSVVDVAAEQHARGWRVTVVGGDPVRMRRALPAGVAVLPGATTVQAWRSVRAAGAADVVHAHMTAAELAVAAARPPGRRVTTRHFAAPRGSTPVVRLLGRLAARAFDEQVAISGYVAARVEGRSTVVPNGVAAPGPAASRERTVLVLQRLEPEKDTALAVRAWAAAGLAAEGWRLVVHGRGSQEPRLRRLVTELGCTQSVTLAGFTDHPRSALASASVLLAPAPGEPFGLTVAEAMAAGTPVLAADGGAHRELLGAHGRYFPPGDVPAAARALAALVHAEDREALGVALRDRAAARFTVARQVDGLERVYRPAPRVGLVSLEPWDEVWRRNQHLAARLVGSGAAASIVFLTPPRGGLAVRSRRSVPVPGVQVLTPPLVVPRRAGGHRVTGAWLRRALADVDLLWINDPAAGVAALRRGVPAVYDVTDDWRSLPQSERDRRRIVAAEDVLAVRARTVVCSLVLADRWRGRYGVRAELVPNGVDLAALRAATPRTPDGPAPHAVYVGTVHPNRVDVELVCRLAARWPGTVHMVGPAAPAAAGPLREAGVRLPGPVPADDVPGWLVAADVLVCPHVVDDFTLSLDAIKAHEYLATDRPVVATPTSGFQALTADGVTVIDASGFVEAAVAAVGGRFPGRKGAVDWDERAAAFAAVLRSIGAPR